MKKLVLLIFLVLLYFPFSEASNVSVKVNSEDVIFLQDKDTYVTYPLELKNNEKTSSFYFYNLMGFEFEPSDNFELAEDKKNSIKLKVYPRQDLDYSGYYSFDFYLKNTKDSSDVKIPLVFKAVELENAFELEASDIDPESSLVYLSIRNKNNYKFDDVTFNFNSEFFNEKKTFDFLPYQRQEFSFNLNKEDFNKLIAGFYTINVDLEYLDLSADFEKTLEFKEKEDLASQEKTSGFLIRKTFIKKSNQGNVPSLTSVQVNRNFFSTFFTTLSPDPTKTERNGFTVTYSWEDKVNPGEALEIHVNTNWLVPLVVLVLIGIVIKLVYGFKYTELPIRKEVSLLRTKGGEFALKVTIILKSRKYLERVNIVDRYPSIVRVFENYSSVFPPQVDAKSNIVRWSFDKLEEGERRVLSYIVFSKVGVLGKFELPRTRSSFEREGEVKRSISNKVYFVSEASK